MTSAQNLTLYILGFLIVIGGLAYGAHLAGLAPKWILVGSLVLLGIGILSAIKSTQRRAPTESD